MLVLKCYKIVFINTIVNTHTRWRLFSLSHRPGLLDTFISCDWVLSSFKTGFKLHSDVPYRNMQRIRMRVISGFLNQNSELLGLIWKSLQLHAFKQIRKCILMYFAITLSLFETWSYIVHYYVGSNKTSHII